jgi:hypothetical protein
VWPPPPPPPPSFCALPPPRYIDSSVPGFGSEGYVNALWSLVPLLRGTDRAKYALFLPVFLRMVQGIAAGKHFQELRDSLTDGTLFSVCDTHRPGARLDHDHDHENKHGVAKGCPSFMGVKKANPGVIYGWFNTMDEQRFVQKIALAMAPPRDGAPLSTDSARRRRGRTATDATRVIALYEQGNPMLSPDAKGKPLFHRASHRVPTLRAKIMDRDTHFATNLAEHLRRFPQRPHSDDRDRPSLFDRLSRVSVPSFIDNTHFTSREGKALSERDLARMSEACLRKLHDGTLSVEEHKEMIRNHPLTDVCMSIADSEAGNAALAKDEAKADMAHLLLRNDALVEVDIITKPLGAAALGGYVATVTDVRHEGCGCERCYVFHPLDSLVYLCEQNMCYLHESRV